MWKSVLMCLILENGHFVVILIHIWVWKPAFYAHFSTVDSFVDNVSTSFPLLKDVDKCGKLTYVQ